ncbi:GIY-YIG nuclease family protein [Allobaculum stercoricanis]|uniref:GIY-YIG nuclease family protein n=1 Tax=Allobaculum stercoricanis TaxID=174709 RepID=UPI002943ADE9|nr:GIY-YIG nuclease family protein [Allobaculum stercoricanis]
MSISNAIDNWCVYKHTCPNNKVYIGITSQKPTRRWRADGSGYNQQLLFYRAIKKHGWDNIKHEILFDGLTKEEAERKEKELIYAYKSNDKRYGYNIENGGRVNKLSEQQKKHLSEVNKGKKASKETRMKISKSNKWKHKLTKEHLDKMTRARRYEFVPWNKGKRGCGSKRVGCYDLNDNLIKIYSSLIEAKEETKACHISDCCKGKRKTDKGFVWKYV